MKSPILVKFQNELFFLIWRLTSEFRMGLKMLKNIFIIVVLLFAINISYATPVSECLSLNVTPFDKIILGDTGFVTVSTEYSPNGEYLLITCSKSTSISNNIYKHYLLDVDSHTFGEINYGIKEFSSYSMPGAKWAPSGDRIYFRVSRNAGPSDYGNCFVVCNPDGTNLRGIGTNYTDLSSIINNLGSIGSQNNLKWSPDSTKIVFDWEKPGDISFGVYLTDENGINVHKLQSEASQPIWKDSNRIFFITDEGNVVLVDNSNDLIRTFQPENKNERYVRFSLRPDREKITLTSTAGNGLFQTYISNADNTNLKKYISNIDGSLLTESVGGRWKQNSSVLLVDHNGCLYIIEDGENNRRLLYEGNATKPRWFPDGKRILFIENKNKLYSIDVNGTNLTFITNFGLTTSYFWSLSGDPQFSISPSGNIIVFTSALNPVTGKIVESEPDSINLKNIAAPLFIINSDGSNLTQVTPTIKGKYDTFEKWNPDEKQFTIGSVLFSKNSGWNYESSSLVELDAWNSSFWKNMSIYEIINSEVPATVDKVQIDESSSTNTSQVVKHEEASKQSPSFMFLQFFSCIMGIWLLHKNREQ